MIKAKKIILDTNIWVSYIIGQKLDEIAQLILDNNLTVFSSKELEEELRDVLSRDKFKELLYFEAGVYVKFIRKLTTYIPITRTFNGCPDEKDNYLFDLALQSESEYLVSGDKLLLEIDIKNIRVVSYRLFRDSFKLK